MRRSVATTAMIVLGAGTAGAEGARDAALAFDAARYDRLTVTVDGASMTLRRYEVVYVANPVVMAEEQPRRAPPPAAAGQPAGPGNHAEPGLSLPATPAAPDPLAMQKMILYVPERAVGNDDTAIVLHVNNGGWFASPVREVIADGAALSGQSDDDRFGKALAEGYVIASLGTRGRGAVAADGSFGGKAPAAVVDAKAAIRYLRLNDEAIPGSAERIVVTGTSGGGGLSAIVAASGNSPDFFPELAEIGAAGIDAAGSSTLRDDVFAAIAYCPITDLGHADLAYEWQYGPLRTAGNTQGGFDDRLRAVSETLASAYPGYLDGRGIARSDGGPLTAAALRASILDLLRAEVERALARGVVIPRLGDDFEIASSGAPFRARNTWLEVADGRVRSIDLDAFLRFVAAITPLKTVPAFDTTANAGHADGGESSLFGPPGLAYANFTAQGWNGNEVAGDGSGPDDTGADFAAWTAGEGRGLARQIALIDPFRYLGIGADAAPYWYIRHGMIDRDTAFAVPVALAHAAAADPSVRDVDMALAWMRPHSGNYDVLEAYAWLAAALADAGPPEP